MRSGGDFAKGPNPAGISGASGSSSTFAADPYYGGKDITYDGKKQETRTEQALGKPDDDVKRKAGQTGTLGGGKQRQEAMSAPGEGIGPHGRGTKSEAEHDSAKGSTHSAGSHTKTSDAAKNSGGSQAQSRGGGGASGSSHGGKEAPLNTATDPKAFSGLGVKQTGKVGESAEDLDWSKISKDTNTTTEMGGEEDPARLADLNLRMKALHTGGDNTGEEANSFRELGEESLD